MRILVAEYACSGAVPIGELPPSIVAEGRGMLLAVAADLRGVRGGEVVVLLEGGLQGGWDGPRAELVQPRGATFQDRLRHAVAGCDAAFVVAPEFDGLLADAEAVVREAGVRWIGCSAEAIAVCGDKWRTFERLQAAGVPTVPTVLAAEEPPWDPPWVVKPRDGAGSLGLRIVGSREVWPADVGAATEIVQPLLGGDARSVGMLVRPDGRASILPVAEQRFAGDEPFRYVGGRVPSDDAGSISAEIRTLAESVLAAVPGLGGYVGIDIVVPPEGSPLVVEINPRLATAYLGYRRLCAGNPMQWLLEDDPAPLEWHDGPVDFEP